jgi:hypothetical protein
VKKASPIYLAQPSLSLPRYEAHVHESYANLSGFLDTLVLVAKSICSSSSFFHKTSKMRKRRSMWSNALQPVMQSTHIHGGRGHNMLKMSSWLSNVTRTAQAHRTYSPSHERLLRLLAVHTFP